MRRVVTLENGSSYRAARGVNIKGLEAGEKITLTYSGFGGTIEASGITPAADWAPVGGSPSPGAANERGAPAAAQGG
jgi:hypothetical protein